MCLMKRLTKKTKKMKKKCVEKKAKTLDHILYFARKSKHKIDRAWLNLKFNTLFILYLNCLMFMPYTFIVYCLLLISQLTLHINAKRAMDFTHS